MNSIITVFVIFIFPAFTLCFLVDRTFLTEKTYLRKSVGRFLLALYVMIMEVYVVEYLLHPGRIIDFSVTGDNATDLKFIITRTAFCLVSAVFLSLVIRIIIKHQHKSGNQDYD